MLRILLSYRGLAVPVFADAKRAKHAVLKGLVGLVAALLPALPAPAADFDDLNGTLSIRAGDNPQQSTPAILGAASLVDNDIDLMTGGFHSTTAGLTISRLGGYQLQFSGVTTATTTKNAPVGQTNASASLIFSQVFTTATPQWLELIANVNTRRADHSLDPEVTAMVTVTRAGEPTPIFTQGDSSGSAVYQRGVFPAGTYTVQGFVTTTAGVAGAHSGLVDGSVLIASLADFNEDGVVSGLDLPTLRNNFGSTTGLFANGDVDGNGRTDGNDFLLWQRQLGTVIPTTPIPTPEPASGLLVAGAMLAAANYCRMRRSAARRASASPAR